MATPEPEAAQALEALFQGHAQGLRGAVRGVLGDAGDVDEALQEAFLKLWKRREKFEHARDPVAWVFVVTLNTARDLRRRKQRRQTTASLGEEHDTPRGPVRDHSSVPLERQESVSAARRAIHRLGEHEREVFLLRTSAELSFEAIARALNIPEGTAKTRMRRALIRLRRQLAAHAPSRQTRTRP